MPSYDGTATARLTGNPEAGRIGGPKRIQSASAGCSIFEATVKPSRSNTL